MNRTEALHGAARIIAGVTLALLAAVPSSFAAQGVLVPIFYGDPGANGSIWRTRLVIYNNSDSALPGIPFNYLCPIPEGCLAPIPAKSSLILNATDGFRYNHGFLLYPGVEESSVTYSLRVFDLSRSGQNFGTAIPVISLDSFRERGLELLDVPVDGAFRTTLRVYAVPPATPRVRVAVFRDRTLDSPAASPARLLRERFYDLSVAGFSSAGESYSAPSGVLVSDLLEGLIPVEGTSLRIEVSSATSGVPVWAMLTVTNNATQFVTVVVPKT